jgi:integrase
MTKSTNALVVAAQQNLAAGKTEHFQPDPALPGHGIRCRRLKSGELSLRWGTPPKRLANGQQRRGDFGNAFTVPVEAARKAAKQFYATIALGQDPSAPRQLAKAEAAAKAKAQELKLGTVAARYLAAKESEVRPTTFKDAKYYLEKRWLSLHEKPIDTITRADVASIISDIADKTGRPSARAARSCLRAFYVWAMEGGLCETNPVIGTNNPAKGIQPRERVLSDAELKALWPHMRPVFKLLLLTGCRRDELGDLHWHELDLEAGTLIIPGARTKTGRALILTLPPAAIEILKLVPKQEGLSCVFGKKPGTGFSSWSTAKLHLDLAVAAATGRTLPHWTIHDLRRTARSNLGKLGVPPHIAELCIGHAQKGIIAVYDRHRYENEIAAALRLWADHLLSIVGENVVQLPRSA